MLLGIVSLLIFTSCGSDDPKVSSITLSQAVLFVQQGETANLFVAYEPSNLETPEYKWSSSNTSVATVDNTGKITALSEGTTIITVFAPDYNLSSTCSVRVTPIVPTGVNLSETMLSMIVGDTHPLVATVIPDNAKDKKLMWSTSNLEVASVDKDGVVTAKKEGTAIITVATNTGSLMAKCEITVSKISVESITLSKSDFDMYEGQISMLTATILPENATYKSLIWKSSDETVVTVVDGKLTALKEGTATITVTGDEGKTANCVVTVRNNNSVDFHPYDGDKQW